MAKTNRAKPDMLTLYSLSSNTQSMVSGVSLCITVTLKRRYRLLLSEATRYIKDSVTLCVKESEK